MFYGRNEELQALDRLKQKKTASLVCVLGRRRIGKSSLIEHFAKKSHHFIEIQGLGPDIQSGKTEQLAHFSEKISETFNCPPRTYTSWTQALKDLAQFTQKNEWVVMLDEISWMGTGAPTFASEIKEAWDLYFKKNNKLILVLCGSVSSWIQENILNNAVFEGRVSLELKLEELELKEINKFWSEKKNHMSSFEKMMILSITGGVPKYLEEVLVNASAEENLLDLCFKKNGLLFNDFDKIFKDIFGRRSKGLEKIIRTCLNQKLTPLELSKKLKVKQTGDLTQALEILDLAGFLSRDYYFNPDGKKSKLSHLRVKDNYLRFYLKYIEPLKERILHGGVTIDSLKSIKGIESILGLQFENLILRNKKELYSFLNLVPRQIISAAPYIQNKKTTNKGKCQIDLLIHADLDVFYLCELKCRRYIDRTVIKEVQKKIELLKLPKRSAVKPVLIYEGEIQGRDLQEIEDYFFKMIPFSELLENENI